MRPVDTQRIQELFDSSVRAYGQGDFSGAEKGLQEVVKYAPNDAQPWFHLANVFALTDRPRRAVAAYSRALALDPTLGNAWHNMGMMHVLQAANSFKALSENVGADDPLHSKANELNGVLLTMLGRDPGPGATVGTSSGIPRSTATQDVADPASQSESDITQSELEAPAVSESAGQPAVVAKAEPRVSDSGQDVEAMVKRMVMTWAQDWSNQNPDAYISHYANDFSPKNSTRESWLQQRQRRLTAPSFIRVEINDLRITVGNDKAVANFRQSYQSDQIADVTKKTLIFELRNGNWKITREFVPSG